MSDQEEEKTPWYATEAMGQTYVWSVVLGILVAIFGLDAVWSFFFLEMLPFAVLAALIAFPAKRYYPIDYSDAFLMAFIVLVVLYLTREEILNFLSIIFKLLS